MTVTALEGLGQVTQMLVSRKASVKTPNHQQDLSFCMSTAPPPRLLVLFLSVAADKAISPAYRGLYAFPAFPRISSADSVWLCMYAFLRSTFVQVIFVPGLWPIHLDMCFLCYILF
jgi:hypothetical protein